MAYYGGARVKKEKGEDACGWSEDVFRGFSKEAHDAKVRLKVDMAEMARDAGVSPAARGSHISSAATCTPRVGARDVNKHGGTHLSAAGPYVKTPKYSGKAGWEAFHAQFELLAQAEGWTTETKALQLALCLTDDALSCLLLLSEEERCDYDALVGALRRRFGQYVQPELLRNELSNRCRRLEEPLRVLANDIESLTRRAYAHMPPSVQSELARDQFIRALLPNELRIQVQLQHPRTLQAALEMAVEREVVCSVNPGNTGMAGPAMVRVTSGCSQGEERPAWVSELTEMMRAVTMQATRRAPSGPRLCWECGQPGHLARECQRARQNQGNFPGTA